MVSTVGSNDTQTIDTEARSTPYTKISNEFGTNLKADSAQDLILPTDYSIWTRSLHRQGQLDTIIWGKKCLFVALNVRSHKLAASKILNSSNHHLIRINPPSPPRLNAIKRGQKLPSKRSTKYAAVVGGSCGGTGRKNTSELRSKRVRLAFHKERDPFLNRSGEQKLRG